MAKRNRIIYASQSVRCNGHLLYRVQTLGANTTFTSEDLFELGHLDVVDVVDDVPAVAVAIDTNDFGSVETMAALAGMNITVMSGAPTASTGYLRSPSSCTGSGTLYYHGVALEDFTICEGVAIWAPVQDESKLGTLDDDIEMSMFMDKVYVNSVTLTYNVGANATENYAAETDNKMWLMNNAKFVSQEEWDLASATVSGGYALALGLGAGNPVPQLSDCKYAFLAYTDESAEGVEVKTSSDREGTIYEVDVDDAGVAVANKFIYDPSAQELLLPTNAASLWTSDITIKVRYAAPAYADTANAVGVNTADRVYAKYFELISSAAAPDYPSTLYPEGVGGLRQGQIEVYVVDPNSVSTNADWDNMWRLQTVTITATPTRTPLQELGHLEPYARPMNFPVEVTTAVTSTAADLENFARFCGKQWSTYDPDQSGTGLDLTLNHLMAKEDLILVVKIYEQTDKDAGGVGWNRKALLEDLASKEFFDPDGTEIGSGSWAGGRGVYPSYSESMAGYVGSCTTPPRERPLKCVVVPNLKITAENYSNSVGGGGGGGTNATQEFNFRSSNKMFVVKGEVNIWDLACLERNPINP